MRAKLFTNEELEKCYDKMSRDGKEYEAISEEELESNLDLTYLATLQGVIIEEVGE